MPAGDFAVCHSNGGDHCCTLSGRVCPYLRDDGPQPAGGRRWVCTLFEEYRASSPGGWSDSKVWDAVHQDSRYQTEVIPQWREKATWVTNWFLDEGIYCGSWPEGLRGLTVTPGDPDYDRKVAFRDLMIAAWQDVQANGYQWPKYSFACCHGGRPEEPA